MKSIKMTFQMSECSVFLIVVCLIEQGLQNNIIFTTFGKVKEINMATGKVSDLLINLESYIYTIDYDYTNGYMYFPRYNKNDILRFRYPSEQTYTYEHVTVATYPVGVVVEPLNNHVYWTEHHSGKIYRCNFNGSFKVVILQTNNAFALSIDYRNRWLYYTTVGSDKQIKRSRLDGTDSQTLVHIHPQLSYGLSIDSAKDQLFWMEYSTGILKSSTYTGGNVMSVINTNISSLNSGIHVHGSRIYCTNNLRLLMVTVSPTVHSTVV